VIEWRRYNWPTTVREFASKGNIWQFLGEGFRLPPIPDETKTWVLAWDPTNHLNWREVVEACPE